MERAKRKKINAQRGFTLVELIVTCAVLLILTTGIAMLMEPTARTARASISLSEDRMICSSILGQITHELAYARRGEVTLSEEGHKAEFANDTYGNVSVFTDADTKLVRVLSGTNDIGLETGAFLDRTADVLFEKSADEKSITVTVTVYFNDIESYKCSDTVMLLNKP